MNALRNYPMGAFNDYYKNPQVLGFSPWTDLTDPQSIVSLVSILKPSY